MYQSKVKSEFLILDFDIEARPLSYMGKDFTTREITAIACKWVNHPKDDETYVWALGQDEPEDMLRDFVEFYDLAGMVVGHYIRGYDLGTVNMSLIEYGMEPLSRKMTHDTYGDLIKHQGYSKSQENLCEMFGIEAPKIGMSQFSWRDANRLTSKGIERTKNRVIGDVFQNIELYKYEKENNLIGKPKEWKPEK